MRLTARSLVLTLALLAIGVALGADETFHGKLVCAKCTLNKTQECQDVLLVTLENDGKKVTTEYYIVKNDVAKEAGEACTEQIDATVTGAVSEKDGTKWLAATKIDKKKT